MTFVLVLLRFIEVSMYQCIYNNVTLYFETKPVQIRQLVVLPEQGLLGLPADSTKQSRLLFNVHVLICYSCFIESKLNRSRSDNPARGFSWVCWNIPATNLWLQMATYYIIAYIYNRSLKQSVKLYLRVCYEIKFSYPNRIDSDQRPFGHTWQESPPFDYAICSFDLMKQFKVYRFYIAYEKHMQVWAF